MVDIAEFRSELCDIYHEEVNVVEPLFSNFGGRTSFGGQITTVKCFEDNGLLYDLLKKAVQQHSLLHGRYRRVQMYRIS